MVFCTINLMVPSTLFLGDNFHINEWMRADLLYKDKPHIRLSKFFSAVSTLMTISGDISHPNNEKNMVH